METRKQVHNQIRRVYKQTLQATKVTKTVGINYNSARWSADLGRIRVQPDLSLVIKYIHSFTAPNCL